MDELLTFPRGPEWEVDLIEDPGFEVVEEELAGLLLVVERPHGVIRAAIPVAQGEALGPLLLDAAMDPMSPCLPSRPEVVWCRRERISLFATGAMMLDARLRADRTLPAVDEAAEGLREHFSVGPPLVPPQPEAWRVLLHRWLEMAPWEYVGSEVRFLFTECDEELSGRLAVIIGQAGEQRGLVLFPSREAHDRFMEREDSSLDFMAAEDAALIAHFDPVGELPPAHVTVLSELGLVCGGLALVTYAFTGEGMHPLEADEEELLLSAMDGVLVTVAHHGEQLNDDVYAIEGIHTSVGDITVLSVPPDLELTRRVFPLEGIKFRVLLSDGEVGDRPHVYLKMAKRDAQRVAKVLAAVDRLAIECDIPGEQTLVAWAGDEEVGVLATVHEDHATWDVWRAAGVGRLMVCAGGATRKTLKPSDVVLELEVTFTDDDSLEGDDPAEQWSPALWDGPISEWPEAAEVLRAYAAPLQVDQMPVREARELLEIAAAIWSAVSKADAGDPGMLEQTEAHMGLDASMSSIMDMMVDRKRRWFGRDGRVFMLNDAFREGGELHIQVTWDLAHR